MAVHRKATLGSVKPSANRWKAMYERQNQRHVPGHTFSTPELAWAWLRSEQTLIDRGDWTPPATRRQEQEAEAQREAETSAPFAAHARVFAFFNLDRFATADRAGVTKRVAREDGFGNRFA